MPAPVPAFAFAEDSLAAANDVASRDTAVQTLARPAVQPRKDSVAVAAAGDRRAASTEREPNIAARLDALKDAAESFFSEMKFDFLYDEARQLFSIGYRVEDNALDPNCYDMLASEARISSFIAIAREDVPPKHWFKLGRTLTPVGHGSALISWSGSMFEYLMPTLVIRAPVGSILDQTSRLVVRRQIEYGRELGVPWGISESLFYARDMDGTYQYAGFGVPDLGYKRGLGENIVIAPYATALAAMVEPAAAAENFQKLTDEGGRGPYGWYEALDYTPSRLPEGAKVAIVRAYMAHHHAMSIVAIADALLEGEMRERFHADAMIKATELLLQERMPRDIPVARPPALKVRSAAKAEHIAPEMKRRFNSPHAGAKTSPAMIGEATFSCAIAAAARPGRRATSRPASNRIITRRPSLKTMRNSFGMMVRSGRLSKSRCLRSTTPRCGASRSPISARARAKSSSPHMPSSSLALMERMQPIRHFPSCSWKPNSLPTPARFWPHGGANRRSNPRSGRPTFW